jgi:hypothetical protein
MKPFFNCKMYTDFRNNFVRGKHNTLKNIFNKIFRYLCDSHMIFHMMTHLLKKKQFKSDRNPRTLQAFIVYWLYVHLI